VGARDLLYSLYERRLSRHLRGLEERPRHVAVMLDGNRRWAREAGFVDVNDGHRVGAAKIADLLAWCEEEGVQVVTLFLLSTDNLSRPADELDPLLEIIADVVDELAGPAAPWRVRIVGALDLLPHLASRTGSRRRPSARSGGGGLELNVAVGYGGRQEIADAVRKLLLRHAEAGTSIEELAEVLDVDHIAQNLYTSGQPDPDLVIRTSGEQRLSGFLLWQSAHSEFWFCEAYWPAFRKVRLPARTARLRRPAPPLRHLTRYWSVPAVDSSVPPYVAPSDPSVADPSADSATCSSSASRAGSASRR
jgi:short-chain Z-isoprenyl diphosphate synthase